MTVALRARSPAGGDSRVGVLAAAMVAALVVGALRFWNLGDLTVERKIIESVAWFLSILVGGVFVGTLLVSGLRDITLASPRPDAHAVRSVSAEDLSVIESELPEMTPPELDGLKGETPEELASALKKIAEGGG